MVIIMNISEEKRTQICAALAKARQDIKDVYKRQERVFTALRDDVNSELDVKWSEMKSYDAGGSSLLFLSLIHI